MSLTYFLVSLLLVFKIRFPRGLLHDHHHPSFWFEYKKVSLKSYGVVSVIVNIFYRLVSTTNSKV